MREITAIDILTDFQECAKNPERYFELQRLAKLRWTPPELLMELPYSARMECIRENEEFEAHFGVPSR